MLTLRHFTQFPPPVYVELWNSGGPDGPIYCAALRGVAAPLSVTARFYMLSAAIEHFKDYNWAWPVSVSRSLNPIEGEIIARNAILVGGVAFCRWYHDEEE